MTTPVLSTGQPSILGVWRKLVASLPGDHSRALAYLDGKISDQGADQPVIADERQVLMLLRAMDS